MVQARHIGDNMTTNTLGLIPKIIYLSVTCVFCLSIVMFLAAFVFLGLGASDMSDTVVGALVSVIIALSRLMIVIVKLVGQGALHGS